jgi:short-subunit dehydrogenase
MPSEIIMDVDDMVDAALAGLDLGETVSIISLPDNRDWEAFKASRAAIYPNISHRDPAPRYRKAKASAG